MNRVFDIYQNLLRLEAWGFWAGEGFVKGMNSKGQNMKEWHIVHFGDSSIALIVG